MVDVKTWWDAAKSYFHPACASVDWMGDLQGLKEKLDRGESKLVCFYRPGYGVEGFATVEIVEGTECNVLYIEAMGGKSKDLWLDAEIMKMAENLARFNKCAKLGAGCRPGAGRLIRKHGWRPVVHIMEKIVDG